MIRAEGLIKRFGSIVALDGINVEINEGVTLILGPNGGGKSTFLKIVAGVYRPTSGTVRVFGRDPWSNEELKREIGVSFDPPSVPSLITGREWLEFIARARGYKKDEVEHVANLFEIDYLDETIRNYSSGMRKRLAIAQAFIGKPRLVILDEPLANLDFDQIRKVVKILKELRERTNFVIVSHIWEPVYGLADEVIVIGGGKVVMKGKAEELREDVKKLFSFRSEND
ncbi:ABC transporter ATP-binding protein [Thermococcus sp.]|uniref:ABC transporter ATP-binding protein n=2 Tax=Thermococcus sp. TaxID=35749 RepID=UPI0026347886|nr:ABC transporter ATP-binding protein [Thermococcus sp.]